MKKQYFFITFLLILNTLFSQNFDRNGNIIELSGLSFEENIIKDFSFDGNKLIFRNYDLGLSEKSYIIESYDFTYTMDNNLTFLLLNNTESFLCLSNEDLCILYDRKSKNPLYIGSCFTEFLGFLSGKNIEASTELVEGQKTYKGSNLCNLTLSSPWVEASKGYGIGDYVIFEPDASYLYFLNGYVSFEKPYLYTANSRVKKVRLSFLDDDSKQSLIVEIKDTPNPQKIGFGFRTKGRVKLEIMDVYPGEKYQDTCINGILLRKY